MTRYNTRIGSICDSKYKYFITFTLSPGNENIELTNFIRVIKKVLSHTDFIEYMINEDYGEDNGRLHLHALVSFETRLDYNMIQTLYKLGNIYIEPIRDKNIIALREYVLKQQAKMLSHSTKQSSGKIWLSRTKKQSIHINIPKKERLIKWATSKRKIKK